MVAIFANRLTPTQKVVGSNPPCSKMMKNGEFGILVHEPKGSVQIYTIRNHHALANGEFHHLPKTFAAKVEFGLSPELSCNSAQLAGLTFQPISTKKSREFLPFFKKWQLIISSVATTLLSSSLHNTNVS